MNKFASNNVCSALKIKLSSYVSTKNNIEHILNENKVCIVSTSFCCNDLCCENIRELSERSRFN